MNGECSGIEGRNLTYRIGAKTLVENVSLTVTAGELVAIVGANGVSKSTLLKLLSGDLQAERGSVSFNGQALERWRSSGKAVPRAICCSTNRPITLSSPTSTGR